MEILSAAVIAFLVMFSATATWSIIATSLKKKQSARASLDEMFEQRKYMRARMVEMFPPEGICVSCGKEYFTPGLLPRHADETYAYAKIPNRRCRPNKPE